VLLTPNIKKQQSIVLNKLVQLLLVSDIDDSYQAIVANKTAEIVGLEQLPRRNGHILRLARLAYRCAQENLECKYHPIITSYFIEEGWIKHQSMVHR